MVDKQLIIWCLTIVLLVGVVHASTSGNITQLKIQPNSTTLDNKYYFNTVTNMTAYFTYADHLLNILQDWHGTIYYENTPNVSMPKSFARWTFDYDEGTEEIDYTIQENSDSNDNIGAWGTPANVIDGNYATSDTPSGSSGTFWMNYTKLSDYKRAIWQVKDGTSLRNLTVPKGCFIAYDTLLAFKHYSNQGVPTEWYCYNGDDWHLLSSGTGATFEEGLYWGKWNLSDTRDRVIDQSLNMSALDGQRVEMFENGTVLYYSFEEVNGTDVIDWSVYQNHGKLSYHNFTSDCAIGMCYNGTEEDSHIKISSIELVTNSSGSSIAFWLNRLQTTELGELVFGNSVSSTRSYVSAQGSTMYVESDTNGDSCRATISTTVGQWNHYVINLHDANRCTIYQNGLNITSANFNSYEADNLTIDSIMGIPTSTHSINGSIDEVYIYNRTLTEDEITNLASQTCHAGYCYNFDGRNTYISIPSMTFDLSGSSSFSFWARKSGNSPDPDRDIILGNSGQNNFKFITFITSGTDSLLFETDTNDDSCAGLAPDDTAWHHYVISIDNYACSIYRDGSDVTTDSTIVDDVTFDRIGGASSKFFSGFIDDLIIYNDTALSSVQAKFLYDNALYQTNLINGSYFVEINATRLNTSNYNNQSELTNLTLATINFTFYDEDTNDQVKNPYYVALTLSNDLFSINYTTDTGSLGISNRLAGEYDIAYSANSTYAIRLNTITVQPFAATQNYTLYMSTSTDLVYVTVYDQSLHTVEGAIITVYRLVGSQWVLTETIPTNFEGVAQLHLTLSTELYRFIIQYDGVIVYTSDETRVYSTEISFQINTGESYFENYYNRNNVIADVSFSNTTNTFIYTYINNNPNTIQACLKTYQVLASGNVLVNSTCTTSSSSIISHVVTQQNGTSYLSQGLLDWGDGLQLMDSELHTYPDYHPSIPSGILYQALASSVFALIAFWSLPFALIAVPASIIIGQYVGLHQIPLFITLPLLIIGIIIAIILRRSN